MALLPPNLDYSDKDFDSLRLRLQSLIRAVYPTWTDFNVANFGNILLELFAFVGDVLGFYQDNNAGESRIVTATQRKSLINLCKLIGFEPSGASAATVDVVFTLKASPTGSVTFPKGTIVQTADVTNPVSFELLADVTIPANANPPSASGTVENSTAELDTFESTGLPNQSFVLSATPYLDESSAPSASDGDYAEVDNFLDSVSSDKHFTVAVDQNNRATITFGNGVNGKIPVGTISVPYKTGGGSAGNVDPNTLTRLSAFFTDSFANPVQASVTNPLKANGGLDQQTNQQIQLLAPASLRALTRTVAREDFELNAMKKPVTGVARALMTTSNEDPGVGENSGILYIVPFGGGVPSQALLTQVKEQFISTPGHPAPYPCTLTFRLAVQAPNYLVVNIFMVAWFQTGVVPAAGALAIRTALAAFFAVTNADGSPNENVDFGYNLRDENGNPIGTVPLEDISRAARNVPQVLRIGGLPSDFLLNGAHADIPIGVQQFPRLGNVQIVNGVDGSSL